MPEERITTIETRDGATHTTVVHDGDRPSRGVGWLVALALVLALVAGLYLFSQSTGSERARDNAVAEAAADVGDAAQKVGNAAEDAAGRIDDR